MYNNRQIHDIEEYTEVPDKTTGRDFSIGLAFGLVVGTIGGLLLAPKSGDALRDDIQDQADKLTKNFTADETDPDIIQLKKEADETTEKLRGKLNEQTESTNNINGKTEEDLKTEVKDDARSDSLSNGQTVDMKEYTALSDKDRSE